jgi:sigma-B regulation protein RsbU (phosphoserine phosphatase)
MCVAVDPTSGGASVVGAGHPPLLVARRSHATETIASVAPPLGLVEHPEFTETIVELQPGDTFLLYTDGLFGSRKSKQPRLAPERLEKMLDHDAPSAEALLGRILSQAVPANDDEALSDDLAAVAVRRTA